MQKYFATYAGIVIQNNDPDGAGKVKLFIPHITPTVYKKWIENKTNKSFKFIGNNINSALTQILSAGEVPNQSTLNVINELKLILPWAQVAAPLIGESGSGRYNSVDLFASISDSNFYSTFIATTSSVSAMANSPGEYFERSENRLVDAFQNAKNNINNPNPLAYQYVPSTYSNRAKGAFSVPSVGTHVWAFFRDGNPLFPVYFAIVHGQNDYQGIFETLSGVGQDYPGTFENNVSNTNDIQTYRNKFVLNQKGGSIEITNTDLKENLKFTHYSGSFIEFNNQTTIELAAKNKQKLVLENEYSTVRGFKNEWTGKNLDEIVIRDKYKKIGTLNYDLFYQWKNTFQIIADNKQLFEIQRTKVNNLQNNGVIYLQRNSSLQTQNGNWATHPVTNGSKTYLELYNNATVNINSVSNNSSDGPKTLASIQLPAIPASFPPVSRYPFESGITWVNGTGYSTSTFNGTWVVEPLKAQLKTIMEQQLPVLANIEKELGIGGSEIIQVTKHKVETIGLVVNDFGSMRLDPVGKMLSNEMLVDDAGVYVNQKESPLIEYVHVQDLPGGNYTLNVCNRFNVLIGAGGLNLKALGSVNIAGTVSNIVGEQVNIASENEINIDAPTVTISADILRLRNKRQRQVFIDSGLGVKSNVVIGGGLHVEGEHFLQHVTAPLEYQVTEQTQVFGDLVVGNTFQATSNKWSGIATITIVASGPNLIQNYNHSHAFKNLPLTLLNANNDVRVAAKVLNQGSRVPASPRMHGYKT